jgi:hypothetical protein
MERCLTATLAVLLLSGSAIAGKKDEPPLLTEEHAHPSGAFVFRTPAGWTVAPTSDPEVIEAAGDGVRVRFHFRWGEQGFDSLHVGCMMETLAGPIESEPRVEYEYDFLSGTLGPFRVLDSAFVVRYDKPVQGSGQWRQRNVTLVGAGQSLCVISHAPLALWKKEKRLRALIDAILASLTFKPAEP